jgi:hypothetical protein
MKFLIMAGMLMVSVPLGWAGNNICTAASDMQANILHVPCLEHAGNEYSVDFDITSMSPVQLQIKKADIIDQGSTEVTTKLACVTGAFEN